MRALSVLALALLAACSSYEYRDTNAAVDANPLCMSRPSQPGEPVSRDCERTTRCMEHEARQPACRFQAPARRALIRIPVSRGPWPQWA